MSRHPMILRHSSGERLNHWLVAILFILTALSGLGFFHPVFYWLTGLFGGGTWARILHPFFGAILALCFLVLVARVWKDNRITSADWQWFKHLGEFLRNRPADIPAIGKYNLGQKLLTRVLLLCMLLLLASGILLWQPWFAPGFSIDMRRIAAVVHAFTAFVILISFIVHVYAAYWTRGAIRSMTRGWVTAAWARHHSALWYEKMTKTAHKEPSKT